MNTTSSNSKQLDPRQYSLSSTAASIGAVVQSERSTSRTNQMQSANEGPSDIIAKVADVRGSKKEDDGFSFTNNEGIPFPAPAHNNTIGRFPLASDLFLFRSTSISGNLSYLNESVKRIVHPCGSGAFGYFECTQDVTNLTKANFLSNLGKKTPIFMRFPTVTLGREFPDEARNLRGFAIKFYTMEGNFDIVGLNFTPSIQGPDGIRSQIPNLRSFPLDFGALFDLAADIPEVNHAGLKLFSDHGTPQCWRFNHCYGYHTFKWVNDDDAFVYIKYHFIAKHRQKQFIDKEVVAIRDLWDAIERGEETEWAAHVQVMQPDQADPEKLGFDPFDVTKVWPRTQFSLQEFGRLVLNKNA